MAFSRTKVLFLTPVVLFISCCSYDMGEARLSLDETGRPVIESLVGQDDVEPCISYVEVFRMQDGNSVMARKISTPEAVCVRRVYLDSDKNVTFSDNVRISKRNAHLYGADVIGNGLKTTVSFVM